MQRSRGKKEKGTLFTTDFADCPNREGVSEKKKKQTCGVFFFWFWPGFESFTRGGGVYKLPAASCRKKRQKIRKEGRGPFGSGGRVTGDGGKDHPRKRGFGSQEETARRFIKRLRTRETLWFPFKKKRFAVDRANQLARGNDEKHASNSKDCIKKPQLR